MSTKSLSKGLFCVECDKFYSSKSKLNRHKREVHSFTVNPIFCPFCKRCFKRRFHMERHVKSIHCNSYFKCKICTTRFVEKYKLKNHYQKKHFLHFCTKCEQVFPFKRVLQKNLTPGIISKETAKQCLQISDHTCEIKRHVCPVKTCKKSYLRKRFLDLHISKNHDIVKLENG